MATIKRHWKTTLLCVMAFVGVAGWLLVSNLTADPAGAETAVASEPTPDATASSAPESEGGRATEDGVDPETYCRIRALREAMSLRNEDLAAMGCNEADAEAVFEAIVEWYETKKVSLDAARRAKGQGEKALRSALRRIGMGPRDESLIATVPALKRAVVAAEAQRRAIVDTMVTAVEAELTESQKGIWAVARRNAGLPSAYRYAKSISGEQVKALMLASRTRSRRMAAARTTDARAGAGTAFRTAETNALSAVPRAAMATARTNMQTNMRGVLKACEEILPLPEELKMDIPVEGLADPSERRP